MNVCVCVCVCSFGKAIGFLGHEVSASAGAGGPDKVMCN